MEEKLIVQISHIRDLGTKSQIAIENSKEHELGIHLKRDAAGYALNYFLKDKSNTQLLHDSLLGYWEFALFFIGAQLNKASTELRVLISPYKKNYAIIAETAPEFSSIVKACDDVGDTLVSFKTLGNKSFNTSDPKSTQNMIEALNHTAEFVEHLLSCEELYRESESSIEQVLKKARWTQLRKISSKIFCQFMLPISIGLITAYLIFLLAWA